jgi:ferredoxin-type protein NapH
MNKKKTELKGERESEDKKKHSFRIFNKPININILRRTSQVFFFIFLIYGGFLMLNQIDTDALPFVQNNPDYVKIDSLEAPQGYTEVLDTYTPFRTCRYLDGNRIFRACSLHYFTEVPAYGVPWYDFIPHFLVIVVLMFIFARVFCGWVCPLGSLSDFLGILRKWIGLENLKLSEKFLKIVKIARIVWLLVLGILAVAIAMPIVGIMAYKNQLFLIACQTCPARNVFPLLSGNMPTWFPFNDPVVAIFSLLGIIFLIMLTLGFFGKRIWCRFCPNGIIQGWFNKGSLFTKEKDVRKCTKCGICLRVCPMDNEYVFEEKINKNVNNQNCINCFSCVDKCPEDGCLKVKFAGKEIFTSKYIPKAQREVENKLSETSVESTEEELQRRLNDAKSTKQSHTTKTENKIENRELARETDTKVTENTTKTENTIGIENTIETDNLHENKTNNSAPEIIAGKKIKIRKTRKNKRK